MEQREVTRESKLEAVQLIHQRGVTVVQTPHVLSPTGTRGNLASHRMKRAVRLS